MAAHSSLSAIVQKSPLNDQELTEGYLDVDVDELEDMLDAQSAQEDDDDEDDALEALLTEGGCILSARIWTILRLTITFPCHS